MAERPAAPIDRRKFLGVTAGAAAASTVLNPAKAHAAAPGPPHRRRRVRFGVNYVPSKNWWFSWSDWDRASIAADLDDIASLGMDHIRIMLVWSELQPNATYVREEQLDRLEELLDLADRIGRHRRFMGFDLSNEIHWYAIPLGMTATPAQGDAWHNALFATCEKGAPGKIHVSGIDHWPWQNDAYWTRHGLATSGTMTANHTWAGWTQVIQRYGSLSVSSTHYSEFFIELIKAFHTDLSRKVWIEETGVSTAWMDAADIPPWTEKSIRAMADCTDLFGITWWDSHDLNPKLSGYVDLEYDLGLFTNDRKLKPIGRTIRKLIAEYDAHPPSPPPRTTALVLPDDLIPVKEFTQFFDPFMNLVAENIRPAVVLESRATDQSYLAARGITDLITPDEK